MALAAATTQQKNDALRAIAARLLAGASRDRARPTSAISANGQANGLSAALQDRLRLDERRLQSLADAVTEIVEQFPTRSVNRCGAARCRTVSRSLRCGCRSGSSGRSTRPDPT